jgi:hypothetical protein
VAPVRLIPLALAVAACGTADARESLVTIDTLPGGIPVLTSAAPLDSGQWSLVHERDVRPGEGMPGELLDPQDLALADDGTLYVVEQSPAIVNVYGPDGAWLRSIGREGDGPGEFRVGFIGLAGDMLVLQDPRNSRAITFRTGDGSVVATRRTTCCYWSPIGVDTEGNVVARAMAPPDTTRGPGQAFMRFAAADTVVDSVYVLERKPDGETPYWRVGEGENIRMMISVPLQPQSTYQLHPNGQFVTGWGGEYRLRFSRDGADTTRIFTRPWTAEPVTQAEKEKIIEDRIAAMTANADFGLDEAVLRRSFDISKIPSLRPAFETTWIDREGRIWVRLPKADTAAVHLDLFDAEGRWLDVLSLAEPGWAETAYRPLAFSRTHLALAVEDEDGLPVVRIYRIERNGS